MGYINRPPLDAGVRRLLHVDQLRQRSLHVRRDHDPHLAPVDHQSQRILGRLYYFVREERGPSVSSRYRGTLLI